MCATAAIQQNFILIFDVVLTTLKFLHVENWAGFWVKERWVLKQYRESHNLLRKLPDNGAFHVDLFLLAGHTFCISKEYSEESNPQHLKYG